MMSRRDRLGILRAQHRKCQRAWNKMLREVHRQHPLAGTPAKEAYAAATNRVLELITRWPSEASAYAAHRDITTVAHRTKLNRKFLREIDA